VAKPVITRRKIERELYLLKTKVEAAWREHEKKPDHGNYPFICPGAGVVGTCTNTAVYLADRLDGDVYGYLIEDNPTAVVGEGEGGHDFTVVGDRYLVDFWAQDSYQYPWLYDMKDRLDMKEVLRMYGDPEKWVKMSARNLALNKKQVRES